MLDGVVLRLRPDRLVQLAEAQAFEGDRLKLDGALAQARDEPARAREQEIAGEDRDRVAPHGVRARDAATHLRIVHDVVVVEGGKMRDLHGLRGDDDLGGVPETELDREQRERGPDALAPRFEEIAGGDVGEIVGEGHLRQEALLDELQPLLEGEREMTFVRRREERLAKTERRLELVAPTQLLCAR